ncbi:cyclic nucleotide-binding domain-containing protein [Nocardia abscessus]|uniref:cyclic nucleotide-binding domain-containing protein n=1 Tax=Nocardia TaxID=1817 RepID=UPI001895F857|nr:MULTISPECIES: cyclic nucleotide-binding domain-containing protein [Nocardia]MBF6223063.1 cyclic nucleotide-binding domain-containing protein [Nocardia abscessus]MDE1673879.1 cyclic nucleotide-binding domain-containing protein [Nocardia gipuzkoensis]
MPTGEELAEFGRLAALSKEELTTLVRAGRDVAFPAGHRVIGEGRPADRCWLIRHGRILLDAQVPGRGNVVLQTLSGGDLLGWSWLVPPYRWHFGAVTAEPVEAVEFDAATLNELADRDPRFGRALALMLFEALLERLQATRARLLDLYQNPSETCTTGPTRIATRGGR